MSLRWARRKKGLVVVDVLRVGRGDRRFDLASALALSPVSGEAPSVGSPLVPTGEHCPFLLLQREPWLGTELD